MGSPDIPARRHRSGRSKPKHHRTGHARHSSAHSQSPTTHVNSGPGRLWPTSSATADKSKENLLQVQDWLNGLQAFGSGSATGGLPHCKTSSSKPPPRPQSGFTITAPWAAQALPVSLSEMPGIAKSIPRSHGLRRQHHRHASLEDSSFIAPKQFADKSRARRPSLSPATEERHFHRGKKRRQSAPDSEESGSSPGLSPPRHNFEKKSRRKTRSDRYNTVKINDTVKMKKPHKRKKQAVVEAKNYRKKYDHLASASEVMDNFNSHSILSDRITMASSTRPGLFDNGRVSKKPISDLTFHEMSFLKQLRREPQKPLARRRESENQRGEREREEISAFFLHKSLPDRHDVQGRRQPDVSGLSSHDDRAENSLSHTSEQWHALKQPKRLPEMEEHFARPPDQIACGKETTTYISWSSSHPSPSFRSPSVSQIHAPDSTPVHIRDALARSGIFDNTGIVYGGGVGYEKTLESGACTKDSLASARSPPMKQMPDEATRADPAQPVRIMCYQDRGTMVDEEIMGSESHANPLPTQNRSALAQAELSATNPEQLEGMASAKVPVSKASDGLRKMTNTTSTDSHNTQVVGQAIDTDEWNRSVEEAPERPKSPKWALVERLEAAAQNMRPLNSLSPPLAKAQTVREPPRSLVGRALDYSFTSNVAPTRSFSQAPMSNHGLSWSASETFQTPVRSTPLELAPAGYSLHPGTLTDKNPTPYVKSHSKPPVGIHCLAQTTRMFPTGEQPAPRTIRIASTWNSGHSAQQSMQAYIAELEKDMLDQPEAGEGKTSPPWKETQITRILNLAELDADSKFESACLQSHAGVNGLALGPAWSSAIDHDWTGFAESEIDEEHRFMSSFWRPNGYPST